MTRAVFLDPDGTASKSDWIMVVIEGDTGVRYTNQCGGLATTERSVEGYLVPLMGAKVNIDDGWVDPMELTRIFHQDGACGSNRPLKASSVHRLREAVAEIPFWTETPEGGSQRHTLQLDEDRLAETVEAWVPVLTVDGRGILVWGNCD